MSWIARACAASAYMSSLQVARLVQPLSRPVRAIYLTPPPCLHIVINGKPCSTGL